MLRVTIALSLFCGPLMAIPAAAQEQDRYVVYEKDKQLGYLNVQQQGAKVDIDYYVDENGRGPKLKETLELDSAGLPKSWRINGKGAAGGQISESFEYKGGVAQWHGLSERGSAKAKSRMFVAASGSPWALSLYARYLMQQPGQEADVLPAGRVRLHKRASLEIGQGETALPVNAYILDGLDIAPEFILLDREGELVAQVGHRQMLLREGLVKDMPQLARIRDELIEAYLGELKSRLSHRFDTPWHVTNVRIFDPVAKALGPLSTVTVYDNKITGVTPGTVTSVTKGERLIDGAGGTLMAGLVDMHAHEGIWSAYYRLAAGVTTVRDLGNNNSWLLSAQRKRRVGAIDGPRVVRGGFLEGMSATNASAGITAASLDEAMEAVRWYANHGYDYIKTYNSLDPAWMKPLADEAHRRGMRIVGHVPAFTTADKMVEAGYDEVTHINQFILQYVLNPGDDPRTTVRLTAMRRLADMDMNGERVRHSIGLMKARNVALDTTVALMERLNSQRDGVTPPGDALYLDHFPMMFQRNRRRTYLSIPDAQADRQHLAARNKLVELVGVLHRAGIRLWPGTDDAVSYTIHRELKLYEEAGIPAAEVLRTATYDSIKELGLDKELGSIERGKTADFILIPGNPLQDITSLRNVNLVVKDGVAFYPSEIYSAFNVKPFSSAPSVR